MKTDSGSKVSIAAAFADKAGEAPPQEADGNGNGTGTVIVSESIPLTPHQPEEPVIAQFESTPRGKRAPVPKGAAKVAAVLPEPQRVVLYKRLADGSEAHIGEYTADEVKTGGGNVQSFIAHHLRHWLDAGVVNTFRCAMKTATGAEQDHGPVKIMGDPIPSPHQQGSPQQPPMSTSDAVSDTMKTLKMLQEMQEKTEERERKRAAEEEERSRKQMELLQAASASKGGMDPLMLIMMMQNMNRPAPPPAANPVEQMALLEGLVGKMVNPIVANQRELNERLERVAMSQASPPPLPEPQKDPMESVVRLIETMKPQVPAVPPLTHADVAKAVAEAIRDAVPKKEEWGLKDVLAAAPVVMPLLTEALGLKRMQDEVSRLRDDLRDARTQPKGDAFMEVIEKAKALREASTIFGGGDSAGGFLGVLDRVLAPDTLDGIRGLVATFKGEDEGGGGEDEFAEGEGEGENQTQAVEKAKPQPVKPSDLQRDTYPAGFDEHVNKMVEAGKAEPTDGEGAQKAIFAVLGSLNHLLKNDMGWRRAVMGALSKIARSGPPALNAFIASYMDGMAKQGKIPEDVAKNLINLFKANANAIIAHIRDRISAGGK